MSDKIISIKNHRKKHQPHFKNRKMLFLTILAGALLGLASWHFFVENVANLDVQIPPSQNITFNNKQPIALTTAQIADKFEKSDGKPILLYIYTTWCKICSQNFPNINELAREFQNTNLEVITIAIDRDVDGAYIQQYLNRFGEVYFQPNFLTHKSGFIEFLQKHQIKYSGRIPFTALISKDGEVLAKFTGVKNKNYLRNKIIKELAL
jgi:peroxiredoxin